MTEGTFVFRMKARKSVEELREEHNKLAESCLEFGNLWGYFFLKNLVWCSEFQQKLGHNHMESIR